MGGGGRRCGLREGLAVVVGDCLLQTVWTGKYGVRRSSGRDEGRSGEVKKADTVGVGIGYAGGGEHELNECKDADG